MLDLTYTIKDKGKVPASMSKNSDIEVSVFVIHNEKIAKIRKPHMDNTNCYMYSYKANTVVENKVSDEAVVVA